MRKKRMLSLLICAAALTVACSQSKSSPPPAEARQADEAKTDKSEIALSPAEQATAALDIQQAKASPQSDMLRANGRIVLADGKSWRLGVRTDGIVIEVYAGLGDFVKKGQVLARFHADEVQETRAQYHAAMSGEVAASRRLLSHRPCGSRPAHNASRAQGGLRAAGRTGTGGPCTCGGGGKKSAN